MVGGDHSPGSGAGPQPQPYRALCVGGDHSPGSGAGPQPQPHLGLGLRVQQDVHHGCQCSLNTRDRRIQHISTYGFLYEKFFKLPFSNCSRCLPFIKVHFFNEVFYYLWFEVLTLIKGACQPVPNKGHVGDFSPTETALLEKILQCPA